MAIHELKIKPLYFEPIIQGIKTFEIRKDDRGYEVGDLLILKEYEKEKYTGNVIIQKVTYTTTYAQEPGYLVLAIKDSDFDTLNQYFSYSKSALLNLGYEPDWVIKSTEEDADEAIASIDMSDCI